MKNARAGALTLWIATALVVAAGPASAQDAAETLPQCGEGQLTEDEHVAIAADFIESLWTTYASGDLASLEQVMTPAGLTSLTTSDWRTRVVADGIVTFSERAGLAELWDSFERCANGSDLAALDLDIIVAIEPGGMIVNAETGRAIEASRGQQRLGIKATFLPPVDPSGAWRVDAVSQTRFRPAYIEPAATVRCPGLRNARQSSDPISMMPWCDANGDGRLVPEFIGRPGGELVIGAVPCWRGAHQIILGMPPGSPLDVGRSSSFVRDPRGSVRGVSGYRRNFKPPKDAVSTGITNGHVTIWTSERLSDKWLLVEVGNRFERWPAVNQPCAG